MLLRSQTVQYALDEAIDLAGRTATAKIRTFVGLQALYSPAVQLSRKWVEEGYVGDILATTLVGSGISWTSPVARDAAYLFDGVSGANLVSVPVMHAVDAVNFVLGEFSSVSAMGAIKRRVIHVSDGGAPITNKTPDHVTVAGKLDNGALASIFFRGGVTRGQNLYNGSAGDIVMSSDVGNLQVADIELRVGRGTDRVTHAVSTDALSNSSSEFATGIGANVLRMYGSIARDIEMGTATVPDFAHAVRRHQTLGAIEASMSRER